MRPIQSSGWCRFWMSSQKYPKIFSSKGMKNVKKHFVLTWKMEKAIADSESWFDVLHADILVPKLSCSYKVGHVKSGTIAIICVFSSSLYRQEILTSELEKEKLFRFSHISIGNVGKTE